MNSGRRVGVGEVLGGGGVGNGEGTLGVKGWESEIESVGYGRKEEGSNQAMKEDGAITKRGPFTTHSQTRGNEIRDPTKKEHGRLAFRRS